MGRVGDSFTAVEAWSAFKEMDPNSIRWQSPSMRSAVSLAKRVATADSTILLYGEAGAGKEFLANMIHSSSPRSDKPMLKLHCAGLSEARMDMELFGCEKGVLAGSNQMYKGLLEQAEGGTVFLDEIGELSLALQARLQRFLQFREIRRVGGIEHFHANLRIIAATRYDLRAMANRGEFRQDLWYRLAVCPIFVPPLRERPEDILSLAETLLTRKSKELGISPPPALSADMRTELLDHDWPGNVHELEICIERSLLLRRGNKLSLCFEEKPETSAVGERLSSETFGAEGFSKLDDLVSDYIKSVLEHTGWRVSGPKGAARILGLNPNTLHSKMRKLNIALPKGRHGKCPC